MGAVPPCGLAGTGRPGRVCWLPAPAAAAGAHPCLAHTQVRTIMYHSDKPADISLMWFLPCVVRHAGHVHK